MIREEVRREYDGLKAKTLIFQTRIKSQLKDPLKICEIHNPEAGKEKVLLAKGTCTCEYVDNHVEKAEIETWYDEVERMTVDKDRYEAQMKAMDIDVHGSQKTNEMPDGYDGIDQQLESLRELLGMIKQYIQKI